MSRGIVENTFIVSTAVAAMFSLTARECLADTQNHVHCSATTTVWVQWSQGIAPVLNQEFRVDCKDAENPDVVLLRGDPRWRVWVVEYVELDEHNPDLDRANLGDLTIDWTEESPDEFVVKIANADDYTGAVDVGSIVLDDANAAWTGLSSLVKGSEIEGSLTGPLTVIDGDLYLTIGGSAGGAITATDVTYLDIGVNLTGAITAGDVSQLLVGAHVTAAITADAMGSIAIVGTMFNALSIDGDADGELSIGLLSGSVAIGGNAEDIEITVMNGGPLEVGGEIAYLEEVIIGNMQNGSTAEFNTSEGDFRGTLTLGNG